MTEQVVEAIRAGQPVILPTDTVYGLCADAFHEAPVRRLYRLKGRGEMQPTAFLAAGVDVVLEAIPELDAHAARVAWALLPGPYTLIFPNPARRLAWLTGRRPETIGVRVPELPPEAQAVLDRVRAVAATSANHPGGRDPRRLDDISDDLRAGCGAALDGGELPGTPSTVLDLTGGEPAVVREGAVPAEVALSRVGELWERAPG